MNLEIVKRTHEWEGFYFGRVAEYDQEIELNELVKDIENLLEEPVKFWRFNDRKVKRVGLVCGNGAPTSCLKEAVENTCDVYITGDFNGTVDFNPGALGVILLQNSLVLKV